MQTIGVKGVWLLDLMCLRLAIHPRDPYTVFASGVSCCECVHVVAIVNVVCGVSEL